MIDMEMMEKIESIEQIDIAMMEEMMEHDANMLDMKELDIIAYNELKGEIESSETYYDELIEKIARDILNGSQNLLLQKLKQKPKHKLKE